MRSKLLTIMIVLAILPASGLAGDDPDRVRISDLSARSFDVGGLKITLKRFWAGSLLTRGYVEIRAENPSAVAITFNPHRLSFVGKNGKQVNIRGRRQRGLVNPDDRAVEVAQLRDVAPGAYINELYELDGRVHLPARLFYEGRELALIIK